MFGHGVANQISSPLTKFVDNKNCGLFFGIFVEDNLALIPNCHTPAITGTVFFNESKIFDLSINKKVPS